MLFCKRQTDNRDRKQNTENQMRQRDPYSAQKDPDNVKNSRKATRGARYLPHMLAEGEERHNTYFKTLDTERDANDSQAERQPGGHIFEKNDKSAENKPDNVSNEVHDAISLM